MHFDNNMAMSLERSPFTSLGIKWNTEEDNKMLSNIMHLIFLLYSIQAWWISNLISASEVHLGWSLRGVEISLLLRLLIISL